MRIKTLSRNASNVIRRAQSHLQSKLHSINIFVNNLERLKKDVERELDEESISHIKQSRDEKYSQALQVKYDVVKSSVEKRYMEANTLQARFAEAKQMIMSTALQYINRLHVELETGGNVRLEEGKSSDVWYHSCIDLVQSRFFKSDFESIGIHNIKITKVTRIHNRFLRNRFEERLDNVTDTSDLSYKKNLEYLFVSENLTYFPINLFEVIEDGFGDPCLSAEMTGGDEAIALTNSISVCEASQVQRLRTSSRRVTSIESSLLICKVYIGNFIQEQGKSMKKKNDVSTDSPQPKILRANYSKYDTVFKNIVDSKQKVWYVFDHLLVLPEYYVEYQLVDEVEAKILDDDKQYSQVISEFPSNSELDMVDIKSLIPSYFEFRNYCNSLEPPNMEACNQILNLPPIIKPRKKLPIISEYALRTLYKVSDFSSITYLNLYGNSLTAIEGLESLVNLETLVLSCNEIQKMEGLQSLKHLINLDLSFNMIKRVEGIEDLLQLSSLDISNNQLSRLDDISMFKLYSFSQIVTINLRNNSVCDVKGYRLFIVNLFPKLKNLDLQSVEHSERTAKNVDHLNDQVVFENSNLCRRFLCSLSMRHDDTLPQVKHFAQIIQQDVYWFNRITRVDLSQLGLSKIHSLEKLCNLSVLNLSKNNISRIEGLEDCMQLVELNLEENNIQKIEGLSTLLLLRKLDLGKNRISKIENLDLLVKLTQLSLEDNEVETLSQLEKLPSLMELYLANNRITDIQELTFCKEVSKMIILDLSGNPFTKHDLYRLHVVYQLQRLKVLDGVSVDALELSRAKEEFSGKITIDFLKEKGEREDFENIDELDISNAEIKDISLLGKLTKLTKLILDNNYIKHLHTIQHLSSLVVLSINCNKLDFKSFGSCLDKLVYLEILCLDSNLISSIAVLQLYKLRNLRTLSLKDNDIAKLEGLEGLSQLQQLFLEKNKIRYLEDQYLSNIPNLRELRVDENFIRTLDGLKCLTMLNSLSLNNNKISDVFEIEKLQSLTKLRDISMQNNPVSRKTNYRIAFILKVPSIISIDGKPIFVEEKDKALSLLRQDAAINSFNGLVVTDPDNINASSLSESNIQYLNPSNAAAPFATLAPPRMNPFAVVSQNNGSISASGSGTSFLLKIPNQRASSITIESDVNRNFSTRYPVINNSYPKDAIEKMILQQQQVQQQQMVSNRSSSAAAKLFGKKKAEVESRLYAESTSLPPPSLETISISNIQKKVIVQSTKYSNIKGMPSPRTTSMLPMVNTNSTKSGGDFYRFFSNGRA